MRIIFNLPAMKLQLFAATAFFAVASLAHAAPRLLVSTPSLAPESTIDLVLDLPAIETSEIGKPVENTWLEITPALPGKLRWKAQNIAEFLPDQSPAIGTTYTFSIPKDRKHLDNTEVPPGKITSLPSEEFRILYNTVPNRWSSAYSKSTGQRILIFNDAVDPATAAGFLSFSSKSGQRVAARLEHATAKQIGYLAKRYRPWAARWNNVDRPTPAPETQLTNTLVVTPLSALPPAKDWQLAVLKGLPNSAAGTRVAKDLQYSIGTIDPFRVTGIACRVIANEPRRIILTFNHPLPETLPEGFLDTAISIAPLPDDLSTEVDGRRIILTGDLLAEDQYNVTLRPGLVCRDGFQLAKGTNKKLKFEHLSPQIALPSEDTGQLAKGNRKYRMYTRNLDSAHIRIKKLTGRNLVRAFQGYRHFTGNGPDNKNIKPTAPVPYSLIVGTPVADSPIDLGNPIDTTKIITFDWNEVLPANLKYGVLFMEATGHSHPDFPSNKNLTTQAIIQLTDIGLAWKLTTGEAMIYAFSCETGAPLPGVRLQLFGEDASALESSTTDASGLCTLPRLDTARHLQAKLGRDTYITAFDSTLETVGLWHFPVRYTWNTPPPSSRQAFLFTDRSLYRPGETVRLKGILRTLHGNAVKPAKGGPARIIITDPTNREILNQPVTISPAGSFDFTHSLAPTRTGTHMIRLEFPDELTAAAEIKDWYERETRMNDAKFTLPLRVEEFRRNAFEITQKFAPPAIGAATASADLTAKYYQGQPVAAGAVKYYSRITTRNPYPERYRDFLFGNHRSYDWGYWYHYFGYGGENEGTTRHSTQLQGDTILSADGSATLSIEVPKTDFPSSREITISSEVTDANHQTLTSRTSTTVHPASVYIGISRIDRLVRAGEEVPLRITAIDTEEMPYGEPLQLTATLSREVNTAIRTQSSSGASTTRNDVTEETVSTFEITLNPAASAAEGQTITLTPKSNGLHFLTLRGTDPQGREFASVARFHVYGSHEYPWKYEDGMRVKLVAEKKSYQPGETARILVLSPIEGTALVTVEREKVLRSFLTPLKADNPVIEIPLTDDDAPNAYVSVLIVKGFRDSARDHKEPQLRLGYCEVLVENQRDTLAVTLDEPAESYRPGEDVTLSGSIMLASGEPAAGAEVTLYAEDEGTLAVMGYATPQPMDHFYKPRRLTVNAGTSFQSFISEDPEMQTFNLKGFFVGGGGDLGKLADLMRKNFDPCATWAPALVTDTSGKFSHNFTLPDTLTRYRIIVVAHHGTTRFGHTESSVIAKKDLMLEQKAPRFAHQSDTINPQVLVQNASAFSGTWEILFNAHATTGTPVCRSLGGEVTRVTLDAGASTTISFPTLVETTGEAVFSWSATPVSLTGTNLTDVLRHRLSDAVESRFQALYPMPLLRQVKFVKLNKPGTTRDLREMLDPTLLDGSGTLDLEFSRSPLAEAGGSIDYLLRYPYGCVEQTTSSLLPWCSVENLKDYVPSFAKISEEKIESAIQAGADRLLSMQLANGSFCYWPGGTQTTDWATPYAGLGLVMASNAGAHVPEAAIDALTQYLIKSLRGLAETKSAHALENHARTLMVLSLAGSPQSSYQNAMIDRLPQLTPGARCQLAAAIAQSNPEDPATLATAREVLTSKVPFTLENNGWMRWKPENALELIAWESIDPNGPEATTALDRMLNDRNPYGHWRTTWVNGWSLIGMGLYAKHDKASTEPVTLSLETNDGTETIQLAPDAPTAIRSMPVGPNMKLTLSADHPAFVRLRIASKPQITPMQPVANNGLSIDRIYHRINPDGSAEPLTEPKVGDLIRVFLRVTLPADDTRYLVIEDPLPAIFETVNTDFKSQNSALGIRTSENEWQISHSELRNDRAVFFLNHIWRKGTYNVTYLARCTLSGQATAPPAKVESMYDPENFALSASRVLTAE